VFWVATAEILADLRIGSLPEAGEVACHLLRAVVGTEKVKDNRDSAAGNMGCVADAEEILNPRGENRCLAGLVRETMPFALDLEVCRSESVDLSESVVAYVLLEHREPVGLFELIE